MLGVHEYLWRLVPANPILLRVVEAGGKRRRDLFVRCGYLALLILVVIFALVGSGSTLGGVAIRSIVLSFAIAAATAFVTASIAMAIATFKVGTRRTIFSFYMLIMIFLVGGFLLDRLNFFHFDVEASGQVDRSKTSWLTG